MLRFNQTKKYVVVIVLVFCSVLVAAYNVPTEDERLEEEEEPLMKIGYSAWANCTELRSLVIINIPNGTTLYDIMRKTAKHDPLNFREEKRGNVNHYITEMAGIHEIPKDGYFWRLYVMQDKPTSYNLPTDAQLTDKNVEEIVIQDNKNFLFWFRPKEITCDVFYSGQSE